VITEFLGIIDRLIKLKEHREKRQSKRFEKIIEPAFNDLLLIHADYIRMFEKVYELLPDPETKAKSSKSKRKLKKAGDYLAEKRRELEPLRFKVRALFVLMASPDQKDSENRNFVVAVAWYLGAGAQLGSPDDVPLSAALVRGGFSSLSSRTGSTGTASRNALERIKDDPNSMRVYVANILTQLRENWSHISEEYGKLKLASAERE
jgi:hypothetical protein